MAKFIIVQLKIRNIKNKIGHNKEEKSKAKMKCIKLKKTHKQVKLKIKKIIK